MTGPGIVRAATPRDLDRVAALWSALGDWHAGLDPAFRQRADAGERVRALLAAWLRDADAALFVCEDGGDLVGFCAVRARAAPPLLEETGRAEITDLAVREDRRRQGAGRALAETALAWAARRGVPRVEVRVAAGNEAGGAFWRALGFGAWMDVLHRRL